MRPDRALATGRDAVADTYHDAWPPYPAALLEAVVAAAGNVSTARVLEIGCGTGKATEPLAERGLAIVALEPGRRLAAEARSRLSRFPRVTVQETMFEEIALPHASFDLVASAQAFHWVDPAVGVPKVIEVLAPEGSIAFFWRRAVHSSAELREGIEQAYSELGVVLPGRGQVFDVAEQIGTGIAASGAFEPVMMSRFSEPISYETAAYVRHLSVYPGHVAMSDDLRERLLSEIARVVDAADGHVPLEIETLLYITRKRWHAPSWARRLPLPVRKLGNRILGR